MSARPIRRWFVAAAALCAIATLVPAPVAHAQIATPLTFTDLGLGDRVELSGLTASQTFVVTSNRDAAATQLTGRALASLDTRRARLEILIGGVSTQVLDVGAAPNGTPFAVSLAGAPTTPQGVVVEFRSSIDPTDEYCRGQYAIPSITLDRLNVTYTQSAVPPTDIASFAPPLLRTVGLWVPGTVSDAIATAAMKLTTGLVRRAGAVPLAIEVHTLTDEDTLPALEYDSFRRDIVLRQPGDGAAILPTTLADGRAGAPVLVLGGPKIALEADMVTSELSRVLVTDSATVAGKDTAAVLPKREQRLTELGLGSTSVAGTGKVKLGLSIPQAAFGGMTKSLTLRISGRHTPIAHNSAANVTVFVNGAMVASSPSTAKGTFRFKPIVVEPTLDRANSVEIIAEERSDSGPCSAQALPIELQVSTDSTATAVLGPSLPISFRRLPQALLPTTDVALADRAPSALATAIEILAGFQRLSPLPINAQIRDIKAIGRSPRSAIVVAHGDGIAGITRKLTPGTGNETIADVQGRKVQLTTETATLQILENAGRMVVIADGPTGDHTLQLAQQIAAQPGGFGSLRSDVIVRAPQGDVIQAQFSDDQPVATTEPAPAAPWKWVAVSAGGIFVAFVAAVALGSRRRRRARRRA